MKILLLCSATYFKYVSVSYYAYYVYMLIVQWLESSREQALIKVDDGDGE